MMEKKLYWKFFFNFFFYICISLFFCAPGLAGEMFFLI